MAKFIWIGGTEQGLTAATGGRAPWHWMGDYAGSTYDISNPKTKTHGFLKGPTGNYFYGNPANWLEILQAGESGAPASLEPNESILLLAQNIPGPGDDVILESRNMGIQGQLNGGFTAGMDTVQGRTAYGGTGAIPHAPLLFGGWSGPRHAAHLKAPYTNEAYYPGWQVNDAATGLSGAVGRPSGGTSGKLASFIVDPSYFGIYHGRDRRGNSWYDSMNTFNNLLHGTVCYTHHAYGGADGGESGGDVGKGGLHQDYYYAHWPVSNQGRNDLGWHGDLDGYQSMSLTHGPRYYWNKNPMHHINETSWPYGCFSQSCCNGQPSWRCLIDVEIADDRQEGKPGWALGLGECALDPTDRDWWATAIAYKGLQINAEYIHIHGGQYAFDRPTSMRLDYSHADFAKIEFKSQSGCEFYGCTFEQFIYDPPLWPQQVQYLYDDAPPQGDSIGSLGVVEYPARFAYHKFKFNAGRITDTMSIAGYTSGQVTIDTRCNAGSEWDDPAQFSTIPVFNYFPYRRSHSAKISANITTANIHPDEVRLLPDGVSGEGQIRDYRVTFYDPRQAGLAANKGLTVTTLNIRDVNQNYAGVDSERWGTDSGHWPEGASIESMTNKGANNLVGIYGAWNFTNMVIEGGRVYLGHNDSDVVPSSSQNTDTVHQNQGNVVITDGKIYDRGYLSTINPNNVNWKKYKLGAGVTHPSATEGMKILGKRAEIDFGTNTHVVSDFQNTGVTSDLYGGAAGIGAQYAGSMSTSYTGK